MRRVDDLGRIVIPKEIRRRLDIKEGDPLEVYANQNGEIVYKKYEEVTLESVAKPYIESIADVRKNVVFVTDCNKIIATSYKDFHFFVGSKLRDEIIEEIKKDFDSFLSEDISCYLIAEDCNDEWSFVIAPIKNCSGVIVGSIIMITGEMDTEPEEWLVQIAAKTIGKQLS